MSGSGISWAICKPASCSRQTTTPVPHHSVFYRPDALPAAQPTASKHYTLAVNTALPAFDAERRAAAMCYCSPVASNQAVSKLLLRPCWDRRTYGHHTIAQNSAPYITRAVSHTHTHPFNGPFSGTTRVSRYQKGKNQSGIY